MIAFPTLGALIPFFYNNVFGGKEGGRKIFMGDTGSLSLGFILSFLVLKYTMNNTELKPQVDGALLIALSTLFVPLLDVFRVVYVRIREGKSPFQPDKNHIHHKLLAVGMSTRRAMVTLVVLAFSLSVLNIVLVPYVNNTLLLTGDVVAWIGLNQWWDRLRDRKRSLR